MRRDMTSAGPDGVTHYRLGLTYDVDETTAAAFLAEGAAATVADGLARGPAPETATVPAAPETATAPPQRGARRPPKPLPPVTE